MLRSTKLNDRLRPYQTKPWPIGRWADAIELMTSCSELPAGAIVRRLRRECESLGANVREQLAAENIEPFVWSEHLVDWYRRTDAFLFESLIWNNLPEKAGMRRWIMDYLRRNRGGSADVFCCGDGLGFDTAALSLDGHRVTYYDPSDRCRRFADAVFCRNGAEVRQVDTPDELGAGNFDVVVCLDVLEHAPDPASLVAQLASLLRPNGLLIVHAPFWYLTEATPTHLRSHRRYVGRMRQLYSSAGLVVRAGRILWNPIVLERASSPARSSVSPWARARLRFCGALMHLDAYAGRLLSAGTRMWLASQSRALSKRLPIDEAEPAESPTDETSVVSPA